MKFRSRALLGSLAALALACTGLPAVAAPSSDPSSPVVDEQVVLTAVPGATSLESAHALLAAKTPMRARTATPSTAEAVSDQRAASQALVSAATAGTLAGAPHPTSVEQEQDLASRTTQTYDESDSPAAVSSVADDEATDAERAAAPKDYMTQAQCLKNKASNTPDGYFRNHWSWCQFIPFIVTRYENGKQVGEIYFETTLIGKGYSGKRQVTFTDYIDKVAVGGKWPRGGSNLHISLDCRGVPDPDHCDAHGSATYFLSEDFESRGVSFTVNSTADGARGTDKRSVGFFNPKYELDNASPTGTEHGYESSFRCDSASYLGSNGACIFDRVNGTFFLFKSDSKVNEAAKHIESAQNDKDSSKRSPAVLTRMVDSKLQQKNTDVAHAACKKISSTTPKGKDCDEYPFKSSYQGAAYAGKHFSVKYITSSDNQNAGNRLGSWFKLDRILDGDAFTVAIRN